MLKGHLYPNTLQLTDKIQWCHIKAYLINVAMTYSLYSNTLHSLYRFVRIVYYTRCSLYQNIYLYIFGIIIQLILSLIQPIPLLFTGIYGYEDYHCQILLTEWIGVMIATVLIWIPPLSITITIYIYT
ncbi:unnamed protein product, partial [Adineta ricciae]